MVREFLPDKNASMRDLILSETAGGVISMPMISFITSSFRVGYVLDKLSPISYTVIDRLHTMKTPKAAGFDEWLDGLSSYLQALVETRLRRIREHNHFGDVRPLGDGLFELRWKNGLRVYFSYIVMADEKAALMLLGGDKNGQNRDIAKARAFLARETA